ncbi:MAG: 50S ribosomal protein L3 [Candidatus Pacearchaeota archaeon]
MAKLSRPRRGSLQYWPRKKASKILPSVNWSGIALKNNKNLLGFIGYKVGMVSVYVKDNTPDSMTKNKRIVIPATIIECPPIKIFSVRFFKNNKLITEVLSNNISKELKRKVKLPKNTTKKIDNVKDYDDISIIVYSNVAKTKIKKSPDIAEICLGGNLEDKISFVKSHLDKEIKINEVFDKLQLVDIRAVTKGKGIQGAVKRYGIGLRQHKSEKGVRRSGSLGPWHPARVTFRVPQAGQTGFFTRVNYNSKVLDIANIDEKNINFLQGFKHFGKIASDFLVISGSVQGPPKRALILTHPLRPTKKQSKKHYEYIGLR